MQVTVRPLWPKEIPLLEEFLYLAIFQRPGQAPLPREIIRQPEIWVYLDGYGASPHDRCLVAEAEGQIIGAVWTRILSGPVKGFGNVDRYTPEFALSVSPQFRGRGIGLRLMQAMLALLREAGYKRASLAVQKDNYAVKLYRQVGFETLRELEEELLMVCPLG